MIRIYLIGIVAMLGIITSVAMATEQLMLNASHQHRLEGKAITFWVDNVQQQWLRIDMGDGAISAWDQRSRYSHIYHYAGRYEVVVLEKANNNQSPNMAMSVYIWSYGLIALFVLGAFLFILIPLFLYGWHLSRQSKQNQALCLSLPEDGKEITLSIKMAKDAKIITPILVVKGQTKE